MNSISEDKQLTDDTRVVSTSPIDIWDGRSGIVDIQGMRFRVTKKRETYGSHPFKIVSVLFAPVGTRLYGLDKLGTYVAVPELRAWKYIPNIKNCEPPPRKRLGDFLYEIFVSVGIKQIPEQETSTEKQHRNTNKIVTSTSVEEFISGKVAQYRLENKSPRAVSLVKEIVKRGIPVLIAQVIGIEAGHPLHGKTRIGIFVFHNSLLWKEMPNFRGEQAGDMYSLWNYYRDIVTEHRKKNCPL